MQTGYSSQEKDCLDSKAFTLDPQDKYLPPGARRSTTTASVIDQGKARLRNGFSTPLSRSSKHSGRPETPTALPPLVEDNSTPDKPQSLRSIFQSIRKSRSAGNGAKRPVSWHRKVFSRAGSSRKVLPSEDVPAVPKIPADIAAVSNAIADNVVSLPYRTAAGPQIIGSPLPLTEATGSLGSDQRPDSTTSTRDHQSLATHNQAFSASESLNATSRVLGASEPIPVLSSSGGRTCVSQPTTTRDMKSPEQSSPEHASDDCNDTSPHDQILRHADAGVERSQESNSKSNSNSNSNLNGLRHPLQGAEPEPRDSCASELASSYSESHLSSYATENNFSPGPASSVTNSGKISPIPSPPGTPATTDFADEDLLSWKHGTEEELFPYSLRPPSRTPPPPPPHLPSPAISKDLSPTDTIKAFYPSMSGFQGYSLPERELGSSLTLRKPETATVSHNSDRSLRRQNSKQDLVQSWNDGSEHHMSALAELIGDLGYLGELIK